jgi:hypothetical protein
VTLAVVGGSFSSPRSRPPIARQYGGVRGVGWLRSVRVDYVVDMAEIPTVQACRARWDGDGLVTVAEGSSWASGRAVELRDGLSPRRRAAAGARRRLTRAELLSGQGGLEVLRLEATFTADAGSSGDLSFRDRTVEGRVGWHEVFASAEPGVALAGSSVPSTSPSGGLRAYPDDLLSSPLDVREATVTFAPGEGSPATSASDGATTARPDVLGGAFPDLVAGRTLMLVALALAFGFGAVHALGPATEGAHGRVPRRRRRRARHAVAVGGAVALMHGVVLALGLVVLVRPGVRSRARVPSARPHLRARGARAGVALLSPGSGAGATAHEHGHRLSGHAHPDHGHGGAASPPASPPDPVLSRRGLFALAVAGGVLRRRALVVLLGSVAIHRVAYGLA